MEAADFQKRAVSGEVARVAPNRKWFGEFLLVKFALGRKVFRTIRNGTYQVVTCFFLLMQP